MTKRQPLIYDEYCGWPYSQPYGMVKPPRKKREPKKKEPKVGDYMRALTARPKECNP